MLPPPARADALAALALAAVVVLACGPWVITHDQVFVARDTAFTWIGAEHAADAVLGRVRYSDAPLGWPLADGAAHADVEIGEGLLGLPLRALGVDPIVQSDVVSVLGALLTAWALHRVARAWLGAGPHTWLAGTIGALGPIQMSHLQHVNLVHHEWTVLAGLAAWAGLSGRRARLTAAAGALVAVSWAFGVYLGLHASFVVVAVAGVAAATRRGDRRAWGALGASTAAAAAFAWAITAPWRDASARYGVSLAAQELRDTSWHLAATLAPHPDVLVHAPLRAIWPVVPLATQWANPPNPGYVVTALAIVGLARAWRAPDRGPWLALVAIGVGAAALALGPDVIWREPDAGWPGPWRIATWVPGLAALRAPARWLALAFAVGGLFAALAVRDAAARAGRWGPLVVALAGVAALAETPPPRVSPFAAATFEPVYAALDDITVEGALYDEALRHDADCGGRGGRALRAATYHQRPLVGGSYARHFPALDDANKRAGAWPDPAAIAWLRDHGVVVVLEHPPLQPFTPTDGARCDERDGHRICVLEPTGPLPATPPPRWRRIAMAPEQRDPTLRDGADDLVVGKPRRRPSPKGAP